MQEGALQTSRFGRFFSGSHCLIEIVFIWPEAMDAELARRVLETVCERPGHHGLVRWRAFGMDLHASGSITLQNCRIEPARAEMRFGSEKHRLPNESFQRLGLVTHWLKGSVAQWLEMQTPSKVVEAQCTRIMRRGHDIACVEGIHLQGPLRRLFGELPRYRASAWLCPRDRRLYFASCTDRDAHEAARLPGRRLACCQDLSSAGDVG